MVHMILEVLAVLPTALYFEMFPIVLPPITQRICDSNSIVNIYGKQVYEDVSLSNLFNSQ